MAYVLLLANNDKRMRQAGELASISLRSICSDTQCTGDIAVDPCEVVGSGTWLSIRRKDSDVDYAQYDCLKWFGASPDDLPLWERLYRNTDLEGNDLLGDGWVYEFTTASRIIIPTEEHVADLVKTMRELSEIGIPY